MKNSLQPYLHFDNECKEAMQFYQELFGGDLEIQIVGESPAKEQFPNEVHAQVLHSTLRNGEFILMASDMCGFGKSDPGNAVELNINCESENEINNLYNELKSGGEVSQELQEQFWGSLFAMVTDKFRVRWMLSFDNEKG